MKVRNLFGTDGVRGLANQGAMTGEVAMAIGRAVAYVLRKMPHHIPSSRSMIPVGLKALEAQSSVRRARIVVGKDTRLSGYMIEQALASGICSMGADCILIGPLPTPGVAFVTQSMRADAGIMISASHNPYYDNGIKIFSAEGFKLPDQVEAEIERLVGGGAHGEIRQSDELLKGRPTHDFIGKASRIDDVHARYLVFLKSLFPKDLDLIGMRVVLDCANGAGYKVAPLVFEELGAEVIRKAVSPNGLNINDHCGALHPEGLASATREFRADLGIALDGDGDRCILADENGDIIDGDQIIGLCALQMKEEGRLRGNAVVTTPMSNMGLEVALREHGIKLLRAPVGDRYVVEEMRKGGFVLGGEQSGHFVNLEYSTTGDGTLAALKVLELMRRSGKRLSELRKRIPLFPQVRRDIQVTSKPPLESLPEVNQAIKDAERSLGREGRVFVRYSGTESLARVMVEGSSIEVISDLAEKMVDSIQKAIGVQASLMSTGAKAAKEKK